MRECGNCTMCCFLMEAPKYDSPIREYCKFCDVDKGCMYYEDRDKDCKEFNCLWKTQEQIPENLRPDKCKIMFELPEGSSTYVGYTDEENLYDITLVLIQKIVDTGHPVIVFNGEKNTVAYVLPENVTVEQVQEDVNRAILKHQNK